MEVEAKARYMRIPPRKARLVAATVIGLPVKDALVVLDFTPKAAAKEVGKVVKSAAANASNNFSQDEDALVVKRIIVNEGPTLKRGRPRARGMYFSIFKRTCHITAVVEAIEQEPRRRARRAGAATETRPKAPKASKAATAAPEPEVEAATENPEVESAAESPEVEASSENPEVEAAAEDSRAADSESDAAEVVPEEQPPAEPEPGNEKGKA
jgi:large subunit ribosomal protein L22